MTSTPFPAAALPPFYGAPTLLRFPEHRTLGLRPSRSFRFAAGAAAIPLTAGEFAVAGRHYPIVFASDAGAMPLAVTGLAAGRNLFVTAEGGWSPGRYVPAYLRRYPFIGIAVENGGPSMLGIDGTSDLISLDAAEDEADPLFDETGGPTESARAAMAFCDEFARDHAATQTFAAALVEHGLLAEKAAQVRLADTGAADASQLRVEGFRTVDETAFRALPAAVVNEFHDRGWLDLVVLHLASQLSWQVLLDAAAQPAAGVA
ncbi:SapC family protein [Methylobacterium sp. ID0610]|uniref:SapC family protein n=1 Tax=Methylobacterium carpenticola TaxID=3344827 RepID=UPI00367F6804